MNIYALDIFVKNQTNYSINYTLRTVNHENFEVIVKIAGSFTDVNSPIVKYDLPNNGARLLIYSERELDAMEINAIETNLLTNMDFIHIPSKYYQINPIKKYNSLNDIQIDIENFILITPQQVTTDLYTFIETASIVDTIDYQKKMEFHLPLKVTRRADDAAASDVDGVQNTTTSNSMYDDEDVEKYFINPKNDKIKFCSFSKRDNVPQYAGVLQGENVILFKNFTYMDESNLIVYTMDNIYANFYSLSPFCGYYQIVYYGNVYYFWVSSKNILISNINSRERNTNQIRSNQFNLVTLSGDVLFLFRDWGKYLRFENFQANDNTLYFYDEHNETLMFMGDLPSDISIIHKENIQSIK